MLLHGERQQRAEHMATNRGVGGMEDRPRAHDRLGATKQLLNLQEVSVSKDRLQPGDLRICTQQEDSIEARFFGELAGVDLEGRPSLAPLVLRKKRR